MSLQFVLGTGREHVHTLIADARQWLRQDPAHEVYFLVPNYNKFEQEKTLLSLLRNQSGSAAFSTTRTQVFSFRRLAWFFLQKSPQFQNTSLSESGAAMIFRQLLLAHQEELTVFGGEVNKTGFIQQLYTLYKELQEGNISAADFTNALGQDAGQPVDQQLKLQDLALIFGRFEEALLARQLRTVNYLEELSSFLQTAELGHVLFIVSDFSRFSAKELQLLAVLMQQGHLEAAFLLDQAYPHEAPSPLSLFYESGSSYFKLYQLAKTRHVKIGTDRFAADTTEAAELEQLRLLWEKSQSQQSFEPLTLGENSHLRIVQAENPQTEVAWVARSIRRKVALEGLRYQDIQILVREPEVYRGLITAAFTQHDIPFYLDQELSMEQHPLVEFLEALFAIKNYHYRLSDIMRLLRTELFLPLAADDDWQQRRDTFRTQVDITENIALANNFQGHFWLQEQDWQLFQFDFENDEMLEVRRQQEQANDVRRLFQRLVPSFFQQLAQASNGREAAAALYAFLEAAGVPDQLTAWRDQEVGRGRLELARNHEQTWQALMHLLDEYVMIYGETPFEWADFQEIFRSGLANLTYGMIPTALDQVRVNRLELARPNQARVTFAIGLNDQVLPAKIEARSLLSAEDKEFLNQRLGDDQYLIDETAQGLNREPFYAYLLFLSATEAIYLSYAANYDVKKDLQISPYLQRIQRSLGIPLESIASLSLASATLDQVSTYRSLVGDLPLIRRQAAHQQQLLPHSWLFLEKLLKDSDWHDLSQKVLTSLQQLNVPVGLNSGLVEQLYGKHLYASVSRLESFYNCQYKYFATYGLKLQEREVYGLTPAATGDFYHEALDRFLKVLISEKISLATMSEEQRLEMTEKVLQEVFGEVRFAVLNRSARMNYIRYQLSRTIEKVGWALQAQSQRTGLTPLQTEVLFGQIAGQKGLPGVEMPLKEGGQLTVRGKIDRVDWAQVGEETWLSVVDYKSSARSFDVTEAYYGLAMQLLTYLDVALLDAARLTGQENVRPAGAYYLQVQNPVLNSSENIAKDTLKKFSYDGLFVDAPQIFETLDHSLAAKENSVLFPIRKDAKETYQKVGQSKGKFYHEEELQLLREHNRRKMQQAGNQILSGEIALDPAYKDKERVACRYCPFRSVCEFDVMLPENQYHRLEPLGKEEVLQRIEGGPAAHE